MNRKENEKKIIAMLDASILSTKVKDVLKKNLKKYDEAMLDNILESLAREDVALERLASDLMHFDAESEKRWDDLESEQIKVADDFVEKTFKELTD